MEAAAGGPTVIYLLPVVNECLGNFFYRLEESRFFIADF